MKRNEPPTWVELLDALQEARDYDWGGKLVFLPDRIVADRVMTRPLPVVEKIARAFHKHTFGGEWYEIGERQKLLCSAVEYLLACNVILPGPGLDSFDVS